ncbi:MAG: response regulator [Gammaproteobacteria bacterium]|nr:response regulator [Gammaproteobacteria bacterium]
MSTVTTSITRAKVLMIDDDAVIRITTQEYLESAGFEFLGEEEGLSGLAAFEENRPDIVILDVNMPVIDGFSICEGLRESPAGKDIPILMVTGEEDIEFINRAYEVGATDFIGKPINYSTLVHRLHCMLHDKRTANRLREADG